MTAAAEVRPGWILGRPPLGKFTAAARIVDAFFSKAGFDVLPLVRGLARAEYPEMAGLDFLQGPLVSPEVEIAEYYRRLRALAAGGDDAAYARTLVRLRALQENEARRLSSVFDFGRQMDPVAVDLALRRADELLTTHEDSPGED